METVSTNRAHGGTQGVYRHASTSTGTDMTFSVYVPPHAQGAKLPVVWYLSGLTCTHANVTDKGEYRAACAALGLIFVAPDTSPRGEGVADDPASAYDFGLGAGFYVDATQEPFARHYRMWRYVTEELPALLSEHFPADMARQSIMGHSMGGHGALTIGLTFPDRFKAVSAFAPIVAPSQVPWGHKALPGYLGPDREVWRRHDAVSLIEDGARVPALLVDQGEADNFLAEQLRPDLLAAACAGAGIDLELRMQPGYDHSYFFISTFMADHLAWHAERLRAASPATIEPVNPATGETLARIAVTPHAEIDAMIARASQAQRAWAARPPVERGRILRRTADLLRERNDALAELETRNTGKPIQETSTVDILSGADCLEYFGGVAATIAGQHLDLGAAAFGYTRREPLGVIAGIGAWNYPLQIACWKAAPALACGNAMLFKPAEATPLTAIELERAFRDAGLPDGLFQVVQGDGEAGRALTVHPGIAKVSVTGSRGTGRAVMAGAAGTPKPVTLELGGKSPLIVFEDAALDNAVSGAMLANFYSTGQVCSNGTRVFVQRSVLAPFLERLVARTQALRIGDPLDPETQIGPLVSERQLHAVLAHVERAKRDGVRVVLGGERLAGAGYDRGFFVQPTILEAADDTAAIVRDEVFGPVMTVLAFDDEEAVIARANATEYGLAAGVFTRDLARGHRVIARLHAGTTWINHYNVTPVELPFGGVKGSGIGRENGLAAIEYYTQLKSVYVALADIESPY